MQRKELIQPLNCRSPIACKTEQRSVKDAFWPAGYCFAYIECLEVSIMENSVTL